jgi:hypothetical protein
MADLTARAEMIRKQAEKAIARHKQADYSSEAPEGLETSEGKPLMGLKRYPEFNALVEELRIKTIREIQAKADKIQSEMPYKQQFVLEELIRQLQELV